MGFKVNGKLAPETEKLDPVTVAALIVTAAVPVDDKVTVCVVAVFTFTLPKPMLAALRPRVGVPPSSCRAKVLATLLALAVRVTVAAVLTAETVAVKLAAVAPAATVTEAGTVTALLLLARLTTNPPVGAAALNVTVQLSVPAPVNDPLVQLRALNVGTPALNCRAKVWAMLFALAVSVTVAAVLTAETVAVKLAVVPPAATVTEAGTVTAELLLVRLTVNPPVGAAALNVTVQLSVPAPIIDPLAQVRLLNTGDPVPF